MKKIEIELTEKQEEFLRVFAEKQYDGAEDNLYTCNAIHVVETYRPHYIPYHEDQIDYFGGLPLQFTTDTDYESWSDNEHEAVKDWYEMKEVDPPFEIVPFEEMQYKTFEIKDDEGNTEDELFVITYEDYFKVYGIDWHAATWLEDNYEPVAFFFILDEAKRYIEYQRHNLRKPRTYTYSSGYANYGDFDHFRNLLMSMGQKLNKEIKDEQTVN